MPRQYRKPTLSHARRRALQRRRTIAAMCGAAALLALVITGVLIVSGRHNGDRAVFATAATQPPVSDGLSESNDLSEGEYGAQSTTVTERMTEEYAATPTPAPTPTPVPAATPDPAANTGSQRAMSRPTPTAAGFMPVFSEADTDEKIIAITVDDCFQAENLQRIVDTAIANGGKLTIFPIGENAIKEEQSKTLKAAWEQGFELENHTYGHSGLYNSTDTRLVEQVFSQQMALSHILGVEYHCHFLRPKGGDARRDQRMHMYAKQLGYYGIAHWSCAGSTSTDKQIAKALKPGAIYLFHTTDNDWDKLKRFIPWVAQQGYQMVTLNEMFDYPDNETQALTMPARDYPAPTLAPYERVYTTLKKTTYSWYAHLLQEKLIELGYLKGEADGVYGADCEAAVKAYQRDHNMEETGVAEPDFIRELLEEK